MNWQPSAQPSSAEGLGAALAEEMILSETPLLEALEQARVAERWSFHMPGHLGGRAFAGSGLDLGLDTTELAQTDNLLNPRPDGPVEQAETLAADYWRVPAAILLAGGSTLGIQAMLLYYVGKNGRLLVGASVHKAVLQTAALLSIEVVSLPSPVTASSLRASLENDAQFDAFLCTSPDYYGTLCDLEAYAKVLEDFSLPFLLDMAHGAHLEAWNRLRKIESSFVPTAAVISAHKTLPALTGGAVLLFREPSDRVGLRRSLDLCGSSSPSLLIAASVDFARAFAETQGETRLRELRASLQAFTEGLDPSYQVWDEEDRDPLRLVIDVSAVGPGTWVEASLAKAALNIEMSDLTRIVCIVSLAAESESLRHLQAELNRLATSQEIRRDLAQRGLLGVEDVGSTEESSAPAPWIQLDHLLQERLSRGGVTRQVLLPSVRHKPSMLLSLRDVVEGGIPLPVDLVPYPPGIVLYQAGERLTEADLSLLEGLLRYEIHVDGLEVVSGDPMLRVPG